jgi:hypothetical protein
MNYLEELFGGIVWRIGWTSFSTPSFITIRALRFAHYDSRITIAHYESRITIATIALAVAEGGQGKYLDSGE